MVREVLADVAALLEQEWGWRAEVERVEELRPHVWRVAAARSEQGPSSATSLIVRLGPGRVDQPSESGISWPAVFANEWAGAVFLNSLEEVADFVPDLIASDHDRQVLISEDIGRGPSLVDVLSGDDPKPAIRALESHARILGAIAAASHDRVAEYRSVRSRAGVAGPASLLDELTSDELLSVLPRFEQELDVGRPTGMGEELAVIDAESREPGRWLAYTPADACPDNNVVGRDRVSIFDFGFGGLRHLALDAAYSVIPFPTCWCYAPLPTEVSDRMLTAFRAEIVRALPEAEDDAVWSSKLGWACAAWFVGFIATVAARELDREKQRGPLSGREAVVGQLAAVGRTIRDHYPATAHLAHELEQRLRTRWQVEHVPTYPALALSSQPAPTQTRPPS